MNEEKSSSLNGCFFFLTQFLTFALVIVVDNSDLRLRAIALQSGFCRLRGAGHSGRVVHPKVLGRTLRRAARG
jgi:hypothetical protein